MVIKEISKTAEVGLDNADPMGITEVLESHSQPLSNEELYDLAQKLIEQQKEDEGEEERGTKEMQTKDLTDIPSTTDMAAEKLWTHKELPNKFCSTCLKAKDLQCVWPTKKKKKAQDHNRSHGLTHVWNMTIIIQCHTTYGPQVLTM